MTIVFDNVDFFYGRRPALEGVTWHIRPGVTGLLGPNGSGKTTLMNLLVGLTRPKRGEIRFGHDGPIRVGFLPQRFTLAGEMRALEMVAYAAWINGVAYKKCRPAADTALAAVGLSDDARRRCRQLSGGQRQRLGIAAALAHDPQLLVLDEPTVGLDPAQRLQLRQVIAKLGERRTVLLSTHLIEDITHLCRRVGVLADRHVVFDGEREELERLITDTPADGLLGSDFERAYYSLVARLRTGK